MIHTYKISLEAQDEKQAKEKMEALTMLAKKLNEKELKKLAQVVEEGGNTFKMAKNFLNL
jgi:hypothetical protein